MKRVRFAFVPPDAARAPERVVLVGETTDWRNGVALQRGTDGVFTADVPLRPGVYAYKLLVDDVWTLDPANPRIVAARGNANSVCVVDGADEPFLFAPAAPWIVATFGGGLRVLVGVRRGAGHASGPLLRTREGEAIAAWRETLMAHAFHDDTHDYFTAHVPSAARSTELEFIAGSARSGVFVRHRPPRGTEAPSWWRDAIVYTVLVDRFRRGDDGAWDLAARTCNPLGGDLAGITRSLDALADLGINCLYLTPVHVAESSHRYDIVDPLRVDPALGGEEAYRALVNAAHARGLRVLQDFSFAHASGEMPEARDVLTHGRASRFASWFQWKGDALVHYGKRECAPLFDLDNSEVQALALASIDAYLARGVDGFRLDMAAEVPLAFAEALRARVVRTNPEAVILGELGPAHAWRWNDALTASTDFAFFEALRASIGAPDVAERIGEALIRGDLTRGVEPRERSVRMLSTHDHVRLATLLTHAGRSDALALYYALLFTLPGIPMLLYGEELGLWSPTQAEIEDVWADRMAMPWSEEDARQAGATLRDIVRALTALRTDHVALREGSLEVVHAEGELLIMRRRARGETLDVVAHFGATPVELELSDDDLPRARVAFVSGDAQLHPGDADGGSEGHVTLGARSVVVIARERVQHARARQNLVLLEDDVRSARALARSRPARIDFAVTEVCNLRCQHCITHAPERTRTGVARTLASSTLAALEDDLAYARYFGFVHGGESLTAPIFWDVLTAIARATAGSAPLVHLLTNGMLLTEPTMARLVESGVTSLSVSIDGASAATNDAIRQGGRFETIGENMRRATALRARLGCDVRVGMSTVVMRENVHELVRIVELARDWGLDWVKLEEGVAATAFAEKSLIAPGAPEVRERVAQACARGAELGLVVVDHTSDPARFVCQMSAPQSAAHAADEYANRAHIVPCWAPWETACIEPSGEVRVGDFFGPIVGQVGTSADASGVGARLSDMWNAEPARRARQDSAAARICTRVTCVREIRSS